MLARRDLLAFAASLPLIPGLPLAPGLPRVPGGWVLARVPDERVVLTELGGPTRLLLPARGCRLIASFRLAGSACAAVSFAGRTAAGEAIELLAVAGGGRVMLLEPWTGTTATGAHIATRLDLLPAERGLILRRDAAVPHAGKSSWERHSWTDLLVASPAGLLDRAVRAPLPDSWQYRLAARRAAVLARLTPPVEAIDDALAATVACWPWQPGS